MLTERSKVPSEQKKDIFFPREGRKPGVFMNPRVIPTCIAFWSGWRERMESRTEKTLRWNTIVIGDFLNLGGVSH